MKTLKTAICLLLGALLSACVAEGLQVCDVTRTVIVRASDADGAQLGADRVREVVLWVFDAQGHFVEAIPTAVEAPTAITARVDRELHVVAWGNLESGEQTVNTGGTHKSAHTVSLAAHPVETGHASPDELFHGQIDLPAGAARTGGTIDGGTVTLPVRPAVGRAAVTLRGFGADDGADARWRTVVRVAASMIGFDGRPFGGEAAYHPEGAFVEPGGDWFAPPFNVIAGEGVAVDVYRDGQPLQTATADSDGNPIVLENGRLTNILIERAKLPGLTDVAQLTVTIKLTGWNNIWIWQTFGR